MIDFSTWLNEVKSLVPAAMPLPDNHFMRRLHEESGMSACVIAGELVENFKKRLEWYANNPDVYLARSCCDCTWRCPRYDSPRCGPCRLVYGHQNFEQEKYPGYGTRAAQDRFQTSSNSK